MDRAGTFLKEALDRRAGSVRPKPWNRITLRRVRTRQVSSLLGGAAVLGGLIVLVLVAVPSISGNPGELTPAAPTEGVLRQLVYVVDNSAAGGSRVLGMNPGSDATQAVLQQNVDEPNPAIVVSPDGTRLFVATVVGTDASWQDQMRVIDVLSGEVVATAPLSHPGDTERLSTVAGNCCPRMAISPDGDWIFFVQVTPGSEGERDFYIGTFDAANHELLPQNALLSGCEPGIQALLPLGGRKVGVACEASHSIKIFNIAADGSGTPTNYSLPAVSDSSTDPNGNPLYLNGLAWAVPAPNGQLIFAATQNGHIFVLDANTGALFDQYTLTLPTDRAIAYGKVEISPEGGHLYLGIGPTDDFNSVGADQVTILDTNPWRVIADQRTHPFTAMALSSTGGYLFMTTSDEHRLTVADSMSLVDVAALEEGLGQLGDLAVPG